MFADFEHLPIVSIPTDSAGPPPIFDSWVLKFIPISQDPYRLSVLTPIINRYRFLEPPPILSDPLLESTTIL